MGFMTKRIAVVLAVCVGFALTADPAAADDQYQYDAAGRLSQVTYHTGQIVTYAYDNRSNVTSIVSSLAVGVEPGPEAPAFANALRVSRPNPARGEARLRFSLARSGKTSLRFFDVSGRLVQTVTDRDYPAGEFEARVMLHKWPAGVYFYRLEAPGFAATRRLVVIK
jgi:YD repeat-containing protein